MYNHEDTVYMLIDLVEITHRHQYNWLPLVTLASRWKSNAVLTMSAFQIVISYKTYRLNLDFAFVKDICPNIGLVQVWIQVYLVGRGS